MTPKKDNQQLPSIPGYCATCKHFPKPDGIAHLCEYWGKLTNSEQSCSNWREKDGSDKPRD